MQAMPLPAAQPTAFVPPPLVPLDAETQYPNQPVTAGLPTGPGPGPEVLPFQSQVSPLRAAVDAAWKETRDPAVLDLLMMLEEQGL